MLTHEISVPIEGGYIDSTLHKSPESKVIVLISHAPGSGRFNLRNRRLMDQLSDAGFSTLLCDWTKVKEIHVDFDHLKMAQSLASILKWLKNHRSFKDLTPALYGSGSGAAFALIAATVMEGSVKAIVCRNGRVEAAVPYLPKVKSPTFIAVGEKDYHLLELNKNAYDKLDCPKQFVVLPGITPFFEEPKKMERMDRMTVDWIDKHLIQKTASPVKMEPQYS